MSVKQHWTLKERMVQPDQNKVQQNAVYDDKTGLFKGLRPVLEGFVVTMHEGACETGSQIPRALARGIWRTVRTSPSALWQQTPTDLS